jgi:PAS domain S-box-containing protein
MLTYLNYKTLVKLILIYTLVCIFFPKFSIAGDERFMVELSDSEKAWIEKHKEVVIAFDRDYSPYSFQNKEGKFDGIAVAFAQEMARRVGLNLKHYPDGTWKNLYEAAKKRDVDVIATLVMRPEREKWFAFTKPYISLTQYIITRKDDKSISKREDIAGKTLALVESYSTTRFVLEEFPSVKVYYVKNLTEAIEAVSIGNADATIAAMGMAQYLISKQGIMNMRFSALYSQGLSEQRFGVRNDWPELASILDKALNSLSDEERLQIYQRWSLPEIAKIETVKKPKWSIHLTDKEKNWLKQHKSIRIGVDPLFAPFEIVTRDGEYKGIAANHIHLIEERVGLKIELVPGLTWKEVISKAKNHAIDVLPCIGITEERKKFLSYTEPYLSFPRVIIARGESGIMTLDDLKKLRVAVQINSSHHGFIKEHTEIEPLLFNTFQDALRALSRGEVEAVIGNLAVATYTIQFQSLSNLKIAGYVSKESFPLAIAVRKDWPELVSILNKALDSISKESQIKLITEWVPIDYAKDLLPSSKKIELNSKEKAWLAEHPVIKVTSEFDWPPFDFVEDGESKGISTDYIRLLGTKIGVNFQFVQGTWAEVLEKFKKKEIDVLHPAADSEERRRFGDFLKPHVLLSNVLVVRDTDKTTVELGDLKGKEMAVVKDYEYHTVIHNHYPDIKLVMAKNPLHALTLVSQGKADGYVDNLNVIEYLIKKKFIANLKILHEVEIPKFKSMPLYIATRKDWPILHTILKKAMDAVTIQEMVQIYSKWGLSFRGEIPVLTSEEKKWLAKHREIRLGIDPTWPPFDFINELGVHQGVSSDYVLRVQKILNVNMVPQKNMSWAQMMGKAKQGDIDVIPCIVKTAERSKYLLFTKPYLKLPNVLVTRDDIPIIGDFSEMNGKKIAVVKGYAIEELLKRDFPNIIKVRANNFEEAVKLVSSGKADGAIGTLASIKYTIQKLGIRDLRVSVTTPYTVPLCFGIRKDWPEMVNILEKSLATITDIERKDIKDKWSNLLVTTQTDWDFIRKIIIYAVSVIIALISIFVVWNRKLERAVNERTMELKQSEAEVRKSEEKYRSLFNAANDAIFIVIVEGEDIRIVDCNIQMMKMLGLTREAIIGKSPLDFSPPIQASGRSSKEVAIEINTAIMKGIPQRFEWTLNKSDGTPVYVESSITRIDIGEEALIQAIVRDMTDHKKAEEKLKKSELSLEKAQQIAHIGNWDWDIVKNTLSWSDEIYRIFGIKQYEFEATYEAFLSFIHPEDREHVIKSVDLALNDNRPYSIDHRIVLPDGSIKVVHEQAEIDYEDGKPTRMIGVVQDITDKKEAEEEKERLWMQLLQSQKLESVGRLTGGLAHDFNNLLQITIGFSSLLSDMLSDDDPVKNMVDKINESGIKATHLISKMLAFSRNQVMEFKTININRIIENFIDLSSRVIGEDIELKLSLDPSIHNILADTTQLDQILMNLFVNARHAMPAGGILTVETKSIFLDEDYVKPFYHANSGNYIELSVADSGCGMSGEVKEKIFEPFYTTKEDGLGTGLGLSTVYGIVNQHNGIIQVDSEPNKGTIFRIYFPVTEGVVLKTITDDTLKPLHGTETLLIVEDETDVLDYFVTVLKSLGYKILSAKNSEDALEISKKSKDKIEILLTDVVMPGMDGYELYRQLKEERPDIKILFLSGYIENPIVLNKIQKYKMPFLRKPVDKIKLSHKIREVLSK